MPTLQAGQKYALKRVPKYVLSNSRDRRQQLLAECVAMRKLSHPFVLRLHYVYEARDCIVLVLDYAARGTLYDVLRDEQRMQLGLESVSTSVELRGASGFPEKRAKQFLAEILSAVHCLHKHNILHRDVKLENVLVGDDVGVASFVLLLPPVASDVVVPRVFSSRFVSSHPNPPQPNPTQPAILGSYLRQRVWPFATPLWRRRASDDGNTRTSLKAPHPATANAELTQNSRKSPTPTRQAYMAPELVRGEQYGRAVDYWCAGVLLFEMLTGHQPFTASTVEEMYTAIVHDEPDLEKLTAARLSASAIELTKGLLNKSAANRLGAGGGGGGGMASIRCHPFFKGFDWDSVKNRLHPARWATAITVSRSAQCITLQEFPRRVARWCGSTPSLNPTQPN